MQRIVAIYVFTAIFGLLINPIKAQIVEPHEFGFSLGAETGYVNGFESSYHKFEVGATAHILYGVSNNFALTFTTGYYEFIGRHYIGGYMNYFNTQIPNYSLLPIQVGFKWYVVPHIYIAFESGYSIQYSKYENYYFERAFSGMILSPGLGYATKRWDIGLRYEVFSDNQPSTKFGFGNSGLIGLNFSYALPALISRQNIPDNFKVSIGPQYGIVLGNYETGSHNAEAGAIAQLEFGTSNISFITFTMGWYNLLPKSIIVADAHAGGYFQEKTPNFAMFPFELGGKINVKHIYIVAKAGVLADAGTYSYFDNQNNQFTAKTEKIVSAGIGYTTKRFDAGFNYDAVLGIHGNYQKTESYGIASLQFAYKIN